MDKMFVSNLEDKEVYHKTKQETESIRSAETNATEENTPSAEESGQTVEARAARLA